MNLKDAVGEMRILPQPTEPQIMSLLGDGYHIVLGDMSKRGDITLKYDLHVRDDVFYVCKMSDSTRDSIVLTPENAAPFDGEFPHISLENYISQRDLIYVDEAGLMLEADLRMGQFSHEAIKNNLEERGEGAMAFSDVFSPFEGVDVLEANIYLVDVDIPGTIKVLSDAIKDVAGAHLVSDPKEADFSIVPMPAQIVTGQNKFFTGQKFDPAEIQQTMKQMAPLISKNAHNIEGILPYMLFFWSGDAAELAAKSTTEARLKAATELADAIRDYHEDKEK